MPHPNRSLTPAGGSQRRYGRVQPPRRRAQSAEPRSRTEPLILPSPPNESADIDLRDTSDEVEITTDLPDCSPDDVRVLSAGRTLRIRAAPSTEEGTAIDRTINLAESVTDADVAVSYDDPTLSVTVEKSTRSR